MARAGIRFRRFEAAFHATPRLDFLGMARLVGLGSPGPFALYIHSTHGAWWALRGAWLVHAEVDPPLHHHPPCEGCAAPCVGGWANGGGIVRATAEVRSRCVVGQASRYDADQIAYHYDRDAARRAMMADSTMKGLALTEIEALFEPNHDVFRARWGPSGKGGAHSHRKLCFVATDREYLVRLLHELSERDDCHFTKYSVEAKDGMYLGRAFMKDDRIVGDLWDKYKRDPKLMCSVQDDDFTLSFRSDLAKG